jgi:hypothetical protein
VEIKKKTRNKKKLTRKERRKRAEEEEATIKDFHHGNSSNMNSYKAKLEPPSLHPLSSQWERQKRQYHSVKVNIKTIVRRVRKKKRKRQTDR